jgi:putative transposase
VKDGLVAKVHHWPGVNGLRALLEHRTIRVRRPRHFFREDGDLPEEIELTLGIPPELGDVEQILEAVRRGVAEVEARMAAERAKTGARVLGRRAVRKQSWRERPRSHEPRFGLRPQVACRNKWARIEVLRRNRAFLEAYREARLLWLAGWRPVFPPGTYWLRRFANVPAASTRTTAIPIAAN